MQRPVEPILPGQCIHPTQGTEEGVGEARSGMASYEGERDTKHTMAGGLEWVDFSLVLVLRGMARQTSDTAEEAL